jgi:hypothetical protein
MLKCDAMAECREEAFPALLLPPSSRSPVPACGRDSTLSDAGCVAVRRDRKVQGIEIR